MNFKQVHRYSAIVILLFTGFHLINHFAIFLEVQNHIELMGEFRLVYRQYFVEVLLIGFVAVQIITGFVLWKKLRKQKNETYSVLQRVSGMYLLVFFLIHISAVFAGRFILQVDTNFYFGAAGLNTFPFNIFFIPYYFFAVLALFIHLGAVHAKKMKKNILKCSPNQQAQIIFVVGFVVGFLLIMGLTNNFSGFEIPAEYKL